jgi:hypothetical protein
MRLAFSLHQIYVEDGNRASPQSSRDEIFRIIARSTSVSLPLGRTQNPWWTRTERFYSLAA